MINCSGSAGWATTMSCSTPWNRSYSLWRSAYSAAESVNLTSAGSISLLSLSLLCV
eukprot:30157_3